VNLLTTVLVGYIQGKKKKTTWLPTWFKIYCTNPSPWPETSGVPDGKAGNNILCFWTKILSKLWILAQVSLLTTVLVRYIQGKKKKKHGCQLGPKLKSPAVTLGIPEISGVPDVKAGNNILFFLIKISE
jgi:hypothetical protein